MSRKNRKQKYNQKNGNIKKSDRPRRKDGASRHSDNIADLVGTDMKPKNSSHLAGSSDMSQISRGKVPGTQVIGGQQVVLNKGYADMYQQESMSGFQRFMFVLIALMAVMGIALGVIATVNPQFFNEIGERMSTAVSGGKEGEGDDTVDAPTYATADESVQAHMDENPGIAAMTLYDLVVSDGFLPAEAKAAVEAATGETLDIEVEPIATDPDAEAEGDGTGVHEVLVEEEGGGSSAGSTGAEAGADAGTDGTDASGSGQTSRSASASE